jgi:putative transposase
MPQSLAQIYLHVVFSTKNRRPFLNNPVLRAETHAYLGGVCQNLDSPSLIVGGAVDHVHILCRLSRKIAIADLLQTLKRDSSKWIKQKNSCLLDFHWQSGYGAFSISPADVPKLRKYIGNQEEHHRRESFQDEFHRLLKKYRIEFDERYLWD